MCGLAGILAKSPSPLEAPLEALLEPITHRGPDHRGRAFLAQPPQKSPSHPCSSFSQVALGHHRLSIVDLSLAGSQPMSCEEGRYWLSYNGEIYNFLSLKKELESLGYTFSSQTDSEVLLKAYMAWGEECLHRLNGMFAFLIWDEGEKKLFGARDRFGIKPLYLYQGSQHFYFASEIKQFTRLQEWSARAEGQSLHDFLLSGLKNHLAETFFQGVSQLRGGECFSLGLEEYQLRRRFWYTLPRVRKELSFEEAAEQLQELLMDSIRLRLQGDVPVGSCLSGGIDSSSIVCFAHEELKKRGGGSQHTFSACSEVPEIDERPYMRLVEEQTGARGWHTFPSWEGMREALPLLVWHQDEPFGSSSLFAQWEVFRLAKEKGVKVMLDGQGADEQLAGYSNYRGVRYQELLRSCRFYTLLKELKEGEKRGEKSLQRLIMNLLPSAWRPLVRKWSGRGYGSRSWLRLENMGLQEKPWKELAPQTVEELCYAQVASLHLPMLLHYEDRSSMAHSVEARTPFLDYRLVEHAMSLCGDYRMSGGESKRVLRKAVKGVIPAGISARRDKVGFATPEQRWMATHQQEVLGMCGQALEQLSPWVAPSILEEVERVVRGKGHFHPLPWRLLCCGKWAERFSVSFL